MSWSKLPAEILEKIFYFAALKQEQDPQEERVYTAHLLDEILRGEKDGTEHTWLLTIEKFSRVSAHWEDVVFNKGNKNLLFPADKTINFVPPKKVLKRAITLLKAGFLSVAKGLEINYPEALYSDDTLYWYTRNLIETQLQAIKVFINGYSTDEDSWTVQKIRPLTNIISKSPNANLFELGILIRSQNDLVLFWQLLLKMVHCNPKPKNIRLSVYQCDIDVKFDDKFSFEFIKTTKASGVGAIEFLQITELPRDRRYADAISHLAENVEVNQLSIPELFVDEWSVLMHPIQAKTFDIEARYLYGVDEEIKWTYLNGFEKVIVEGSAYEFTLIAENVDHPNVHFVFDDQFILPDTRNEMMHDERYYYLSYLIDTLPASKVKTITVPKEELLPIPETTFICDDHLADKFYDFIEDAQVRRNS